MSNLFFERSLAMKFGLAWTNLNWPPRGPYKELNREMGGVY